MTQVVTSIVNRNPGPMKPIGVVIHNDAGPLTGVGYKSFLANHPLENGFAHYYVSEGSILLAQYTDRIAWHTGNAWGNANLIGFEVCQSMTASDAQFLRNEEETFKLVAEVMKSYNIPINEKTVWLHKELSPTACPHRSWELHGRSVVSVKKYFVERIQYYANGGKITEEKKQETSENQQVIKVNTKVNRGRSKNAYFMGTIDNLGAEVRKRSGNRLKGFNWNRKAGYQLKPGDTVYIFEIHNGWGRIYTGNLTGKGSNDWIWLGRMKVNKVFK